MKGTQTPNSFGKEVVLVNDSISKGALKCQQVMLPDMPNWVDKVIRMHPDCTNQTFVHYKSTVSKEEQNYTSKS